MLRVHEAATFALLLGGAGAIACGKAESRPKASPSASDGSAGGGAASSSAGRGQDGAGATNSSTPGAAGEIATNPGGGAGGGGEPGAGGAGEVVREPTFEPTSGVEWTRPGTFAFAQTITPADVDGDGNVDLALGLDQYGVTLLLGKGDGTFALGAQYVSSKFVTSTSRIYGVWIADFDGDEQLDLAVGNERLEQNNASVGLLVGDGKGHFAGPEDFEQTGPGRHVGAIAAADFDRDGWLDLVASGGSVDLLMNDTKGGFVPAESLASATSEGAAVGDLNGDGASDVVITLAYSARPLQVRLNDGSGVFLPAVDYAAGDVPKTEPNLLGVAIGDLDKDGAPDLVAGSQAQAGIDIFWGRGDGTFTEPLFVSTNGSCWAVGIGDLNGDGHPEIAATSYAASTSRLVVLTNDGQRGFHAAAPWPLGSFDRALTLVDLNHDGRLDVATAGQSTPNLHIWLNTTTP